MLNVPAEFEVVAALTIGYLADPADVDEELHSRDAKPRTRKELDEYVFSADWGAASGL